MKLYPPYIEGKLPAFVYNSGITDVTNIVVPFQLNPMVGQEDIERINLILKTLSGTQVGEIVSTQNIVYGATEAKAEFEIPTANVTIGQFYKIQIAFVATNGAVGYYSSVGIAKCIDQPEVTIKSLTEDIVTTNLTEYEYEYTYAPVVEGSSTIIDTEKIYSYRFDVYDSKQELYDTSGEVIQNAELNSNKSTWALNKPLEQDKIYYIVCVVTTQNNYTLSSPLYPILEGAYANLSNFYDFYEPFNFHIFPQQEQGYNLIYIGSDVNKRVNGTYKIVKASSEDNYKTWYDIFEFSIANSIVQEVSDSDELKFKDFFLKHGVSYKYALQRINSKGVRAIRWSAKDCRGVEISPILTEFEDMYLYDGERQLRIAFNPKVSSFKTTLLETKIDTLGGTYPVFYRNGNIRYGEFSISGLISIHADKNFEFFDRKKLKQIFKHENDYVAPQRPGTLYSTEEGFQLTTSLTTEMITLEEEFKKEVLEWLNDGKPKLFRSPVEGYFLVRLMNVSLSPNDTLGRMLHTFNATAYEIGKSDLISLMKMEAFKPEKVELDIIKKEKVVINDVDITLDRENYLELEIIGCKDPSFKIAAPSETETDTPCVPYNNAYGYRIWKDDYSKDKEYKITDVLPTEVGRTYYNIKYKKPTTHVTVGDTIIEDTFETKDPIKLYYTDGDDPRDNNGYFIQSIYVEGLETGQWVSVKRAGQKSLYVQNNQFKLVEAKVEDCTFIKPVGSEAKITYYYYCTEEPKEEEAS